MLDLAGKKGSRAEVWDRFFPKSEPSSEAAAHNATGRARAMVIAMTSVVRRPAAAASGFRTCAQALACGDGSDPELGSRAFTDHKFLPIAYCFNISDFLQLYMSFKH